VSDFSTGDGSGDVVAVGSGVNDVSVGDRVAGFTYGVSRTTGKAAKVGASN